MVEHLLCKQGVIGSNPIVSIIAFGCGLCSQVVGDFQSPTGSNPIVSIIAFGCGLCPQVVGDFQSPTGSNPIGFVSSREW